MKEPTHELDTLRTAAEQLCNYTESFAKTHLHATPYADYSPMGATLLRLVSEVRTHLATPPAHAAAPVVCGECGGPCDLSGNGNDAHYIRCSRVCTGVTGGVRT